ncbi:MAG: response regulator [Candidatus Limnocylindrales bacterium]
MAGERILFVDDEGQIRKLLQTYLERRGYRVSVATDGYEALLAIKRETPDLVITDVNMPNMNGLELCRRLRSEHKTARVPIIMLSARKAADDVLSGYAQGADEYVPKPVEMSLLSAKVEGLLRRAAAAAVSPGAAAANRGRVCLFLHGKGGVGATTLAVNSAISLAFTTIYRVALLDLSVEFGNAALLLDLRPRRTLADLAETRIEDMDEELFGTFVSQHASGVRLVTASDLPERAELVTVAAAQHAIDRLRSSSDYVVVDSPASFSQLNLAAIDAADLICLVTAPHLASMKVTLDCLETLEKLGYPKGRILLIVNRVTEHGLEHEAVTRFFGRPPDLVVPYTGPFDQAADQGKPLVISSPENAGSTLMRDLAAKIAVAAPVAR